MPCTSTDPNAEIDGQTQYKSKQGGIGRRGVFLADIFFTYNARRIQQLHAVLYCDCLLYCKDTVEITIDTVAAGLLVLLYVPGYGSTSATRYHTATVKYTVPVQHTRYPGKKFTHTII